MNKVGLLGKKIKYSKSPLLYSLFAQLSESSIEFKLFDCDSKKIESVIAKVRNKELQGLSVTIPYKIKVIEYCDVLTPAAKDSGAVNTLYLDSEGNLVGDNTDIEGLRYLISLNNISFDNKKILLFGTGGAARAAYYLLHDYDITVVSRHPENATSFKKVISYQEVNNTYDIYINATPVGTNSNKKCIVNPLIINGKTTIDLVYKPAKTAFVKAGNPGISGIDMLIGQGIIGYEIYTKETLQLTNDDIEKIKNFLIK
jgi:shikimate dehydrogenase